MALEVALATTPPASCSSRWRPKSINTPIMLSFAAICTTAIRDGATGNWPVCMAPLRAKTIFATSATAWARPFIDQITAVAVDFLYRFGLIKGELLSTDGQLESSYSRYKGCTYACQTCRALPIDAAGQQALREQFQSGAKRLQLTCPFPDVVEKVRAATAKSGTPRDP